MMSGIRKYKGILIYFLILTILVFVKQSGFYFSFTPYDYDVEDSIKAKPDNFASKIVFTRDIKHLKVLKIVKKVSLDRVVIRNVKFSAKQFSIFNIYKSFNISINTSILRLNCILRI